MWLWGIVRNGDDHDIFFSSNWIQIMKTSAQDFYFPFFLPSGGIDTGSVLHSSGRVARVLQCLACYVCTDLADLLPSTCAVHGL